MTRRYWKRALTLGALLALGGCSEESAREGQEQAAATRQEGLTTLLGPTLVRDFNPYGYDNSSNPYVFGSAGGRVFFTADDGSSGQELWRSDGTAAGTLLLKDIQPGLSSSGPYLVASGDSVVYFSASTPEYGRELWKTDGSAAGTVMVADLSPGPSTPTCSRPPRLATPSSSPTTIPSTAASSSRRMAPRRARCW
jgi:ELWxxDGT repeat protein